MTHFGVMPLDGTGASDESLPHGAAHGLFRIAHLQLPVDVPDVRPNGLEGDPQSVGGFGIGEALDEAHEDIALAVRQ